MWEIVSLSLVSKNFTEIKVDPVTHRVERDENGDISVVRLVESSEPGC